MADLRQLSGRPVLIAGAGIAGLAAAIALARAGIASITVDRRGDLAEVGAGIQVGPNGVKILRRLGAAERSGETAATPDAVRISSGASGKLLAEVPLGRTIAARHGAPYWTMAREDLHRALREAAASHADLVSLETGTAAAAFTSEATGVTLKVEGRERPLAGAALVLASGLWGRIGEARIPLVATSKLAARALIPIDRVPTGFADNAVGLWLGADAHLVHYPVAAGRLVNVVAVLEGDTLPETWNAPAEKSHILKGFEHWADPPRRLLEAVTEWRQWRLYQAAAEAPPLPGNVIRIGDAAGPVLPFLAQGGVLALEDAAALAAALASVGEPRTAFDAIRAGRLARRAEIAKASRDNGRIYHLDGLAAKARDLVLRASSPDRLLRRFDWLYGFEA